MVCPCSRCRCRFSLLARVCSRLASGVEVQHHGVRRVLFVRQEMQLQGGPSLRERGVRGGMQHAQDGAVKLETDSHGEQRLGEKFAFVCMSISLVVAWVVCCHGYKAGCNPCARFEPIPLS